MSTFLTRFSIIKKILMLPVIFSLSGCVYLVVGSIGALGGYVVSPDTVEGTTHTDDATVWEGALEVVSIMGTLKETSEEAGIILADINGVDVTISLIPLSATDTTVRVKARKMLFPKIRIAQNVYVKVMSKFMQ